MFRLQIRQQILCVADLVINNYLLVGKKRMWQIKQHWLCLSLQILRLVLICAQFFHQLWCSRRVPLLLCDADDLNIVAMAYKWHWRQVWQRSARWPVVYR